MKKLLLFVVLLNLQQQIFSQNLGIGTNTPNSSAVLDIASSSKGLLIPRVALQSIIDANTIPSPATSLLVYNTNIFMSGGTGYFFNNGTSASPNWTKLGDLTFPFYKSITNSGSAFQIENNSVATTSSAISGYSLGGTAISAASSSGYALEASGKIKITGAGQSIYYGKVLTSDGYGNATWDGAIAFSAHGVPQANKFLPTAIYKKVIFATEQYDLQGNFSNAASANPGVFTVPVNGIYHFDSQVTNDAVPNNSYAVFHEMRMMLKRNGVTSMISETRGMAAVPGRVSLRIDLDYPLQANDEIWVEAWNDANSGDNIIDLPTLTYFSGHMLTKTAPGLFF